MTIYNWKRELGQIKPQNKYSDSQQKQLMKRYYKIKDQNPKIKDAEIAKMLKIGSATLIRWKKQFIRQQFRPNSVDGHSVEENAAENRLTPSLSSSLTQSSSCSMLVRYISSLMTSWKRVWNSWSSPRQYHRSVPRQTANNSCMREQNVLAPPFRLLCADSKVRAFRPQPFEKH
uniref:Transposase n=1 Tax=Globodera rostochiensis TaxID=31243 RepID=A0A914HRD4_GLORO